MKGNAPPVETGTRGAMTHSRHRANPRDYLTVPALFGRSDAGEWLPAPMGDDVALAIAQVQHQVALAIDQRRDPSAARRITNRFGFSVQSWSDYTLGKAWMTPASWAAASTLLLERDLPGE